MNQEKALPRLDNEEIDIVWQSMPGGPAHWLKGFGYQNYAKAIEDELLLKIARHQVGAEARIVTYVPSRARKGVLKVTAYGPPDMELPPHREVLSDRLMYPIQGCTPAPLDLSALEDEQASAAPASVKDHVIREVVNELRDIAKEHHNSGQLRVRLRAALEPLIK
jgi:hypothetical protein